MTGECTTSRETCRHQRSAGADVIPGDRYHVVRVLKRGKHVETLLAIDATCGAAVVVKLVAEKSISRDVRIPTEA